MWDGSGCEGFRLSQSIAGDRPSNKRPCAGGGEGQIMVLAWAAGLDGTREIKLLDVIHPGK